MTSLKLFRRLNQGNLVSFLERYVPKKIDRLLDPYITDKTGLPMMIYISQQQHNKPACLEVSQYYPTSIKKNFSSQETFSVTIPRNTQSNTRIIGDTGEITLRDLLKVDKFIQLNSDLLLGVWDMNEDVIVHKYLYYWDHIIKLEE